jgi:hypothetical protein
MRRKAFSNGLGVSDSVVVGWDSGSGFFDRGIEGFDIKIEALIRKIGVLVREMRRLEN